MMPRRIPDYPDIYWTWNYFSSIGSIISLIGLFVFLYLMWNMFTINTIGLQYKNLFYFLIKGNNNQKLLLSLKKIEFFLLSHIYKKKNNFLYTIIYFLIKDILSLIYSILTIQNYYFIKYNFMNYFNKFNFFVYLDRYYYSNLLYKLLNVWNISLNIYDNNKIKNSTNDIYDLLSFFSYNYIIIFTLFITISKEIVNKIIILKFKFIIYNLYLNKYINVIFNSLFIYTYKNQIKKSYLK